MYIRTKNVSKTQNCVVQLAESYREGDKTKQRVIQHVGTAHNSAELAELKELAGRIKVEVEHQRLLKTGKTINQEFASQLGPTIRLKKSTKVDLLDVKEEARCILGIHDIYGLVYKLLNFTNPFSRAKQRQKAAKILREIVLARIAQPTSKRATVELLNTRFGLKLKLDNVYQMMDKVDDIFCERIQENALAATLRLTGEKLKVLFYDATTLYFESFTEDDLKQNGYSKDMKFNQPQLLLALFVTQDGLPVGYELFPGATYEGHTLKPVLEKLKKRYQIDEMVFVADRGMLSKDNLEYLEKNNVPYIVGARVKSLSKDSKKNILAWSAKIKDALQAKEAGDTSEVERTHRMQLKNKKTIILSYSEKRARKDAHDREKAIAKLHKKLAKSKNPKTVVSNYGYQKFLIIEGNAQLKINEDKLNEEAKWDGLSAVYTNHTSLSNKKVLQHYRSLWQVEESFRITKHDLRIRPIYHWTPQRIKAHIAICFMAFTCVRYLEYRVSRQYQKLSPRQIRKALLGVQASIIREKQTDRKYMLPSVISPLAKQIYRVFNIKTPQAVMKLQ